MSLWFRMYSEVANDPKVQRLPAELFRFWVNCMCLAANNGGNIPSVHDIAWLLRKSEKLIAAQVAALYEAELLDREGDTFSPHNWAIRQYKSDTSTERVQRFRKQHGTFRDRSIRNGDGTPPETVPVTDQSRTETETEAEQIPLAPQGGQDANETAADMRSVVRSAVPAVEDCGSGSPRRKRGRRTTEEIKKALGLERWPWWEGFWKVFPCHEGMNPAMDAYERKVHTREMALAIYGGAKRYAEQMEGRWRLDPNAGVKYGQGWINAERWTDEARAVSDMRPTVTQVRDAKIAEGLGVLENIRRMQ